MLDEIKQIDSSLKFVNSLCKYKKFKTINSVQMRVEQLEVCDFWLSQAIFIEKAVSFYSVFRKRKSTSSSI